MNHALVFARQWLGSYGYAGLFGAVFVESFSIPVPGQASLMASAMLARTGDMNIAWVLVTVWTTAFSGDTLGYLIGRRWDRRALIRLPVSWLFSPALSMASARATALPPVVLKFTIF